MAATKHPTLYEICWAAGIYEGEGSTRRQGEVSVPQKDPELLFKLRDLFGGRVKKGNTENIWRWEANGKHGRGFLMTIYSMLTQRRKAQVRAALGK